MYKNQLQELAQRSCFNLPSYTCIREGPDHAPRFKATVNFNGEIFESPSFCTTLRQAEHSAAEVALTSLSTQGSSHSLAARILVSGCAKSGFSVFSTVGISLKLGQCDQFFPALEIMRQNFHVDWGKMLSVVPALQIIRSSNEK